MDFTTIDALSKLITILLRTTLNQQQIDDFFEKILDSILIVFTKYHTYESQSFNPRPFFRLFFNILSDFKKP